MATTTKTLTPTNQTITLPDMTERPDASVLVDGIGKDADAINALSDQIGTLNSKITGKMPVWSEESTFDGTVFPTTYPVRGRNQYTTVARNISTGSLYVLWYSESQGGFRVGATISGSAPSTNDKVVVCYPVNW